MMWKESAAVGMVFLILAGIGLGPALWLVKDGPRRLQYGCCLSPALGVLLIGLLGFPLARYVGVMGIWVWPATLGLLVGSAALCLRAWPAIRLDWPAAAFARRFAVPIILLGMLLGLLVLPMLYSGMQHAVFRGNAGDAFLYISQAQALQEAPVQVQLEGALLADREGVAKLAHRSPVAVFSARTLLLPLSLNRAAAHAWTAQLAGLPSWRFYYGFHLVIFAAAACAGLGLAMLMGVPHLLAYATAAAVGVGFWARWVLESDAGYQMAAMPALLLLVFAWIETELEPALLWSRSRWLLALALSGVVAIYSAFLPPLLMAGAVYYGLALVQRTAPFRRLGYHGLTAVTAVLLIAVTGQLDWLGKNARAILAGLNDLPTFSGSHSAGLTIIGSDGLAALWGLPARLLFSGLPLHQLMPLEAVFQFLAVTLTLAAIGGGLCVLRRPGEVGHRVVLCMSAAGLLTLAVLVIVDKTPNNVNNYAAGKAYTFIYPFPILLAMIYPRFAKAYSSASQARWIAACLALWGGLQVALGLYIPFHTQRRPPFVLAHKINSYDIRPITQVLNERRVQGLLVFTPREGHFTFPYYLMFALAPYQPHFQSGLVIDNADRTPNLWVDKIRTVPEYAVVTRKADYVGPNHLGERVAETADLILYRLTDRNPEIYRKVENARERLEQSRPVDDLLIGQPNDPAVILVNPSRRPGSGARSSP